MSKFFSEEHRKNLSIAMKNYRLRKNGRSSFFDTVEGKRKWQREYKLKWKYNLSIKERDFLLNKQKNQCQICQVSFDYKKMCVDHCHKTNKVRGLLCTKCNVLLGYANDSIDILLKSINYLKNNETIPTPKKISR